MEPNQRSSSIPEVDIIIPTYNNYDSLIKTLRSLEKQTIPNFYVHICIDGSFKEIEQRLPKEDLTIDYHLLTHPHQEHRGRNATRNLALPSIRSKYILTIDSDAEASPSLIEAHLSVVNDSVISVGMFEYTNTNENIWAKYLSVRGNAKHHHLEELPYYYFKTGNVCFPASFFLELGGQDENMKQYGGGDTEFSMRMYQRFSPKYLNNSEAIVYSQMDKDIETALEQFFEFGSINLPYILKKHPLETNIFSVKTILFNPILSFLLQLPFSLVLSPILRYLPSFFQIKVLHLCVASQIVRGYKSSTKE